MRYYVLFTFVILLQTMNAQFVANYDESKVPEFDLPDPLTTFSNNKILTSTSWTELRRPELINFFESQVFGKVPGTIDTIDFEVIEESNSALGGVAKRRQIKVTLSKNGKTISYLVLLYLPKNIANAPIFLGYNFHGNHTVNSDPEIIISDAWSLNNEAIGITNHTLTEESRGMRSNRWAITKMIEAGYGLATIYYGEIDPDKNDFADGVHALFYSGSQKRPAKDEWGAIGAWAWALSRTMDYLGNNSEIDKTKVIVFGHSRLGKAALWAGVMDERFAGVISNDSGCGGAALSKRRFGETIAQINETFPYWFSENFKKYNNAEDKLPVDQHELLALIAPRPLYVASAKEDEWADPKGEFLSAYYATPVYSLFGKAGIPAIEMPVVNSPIHNTVAYHIRTGKHDVTEYDWEQYIKWAVEQFH
ncbi:acetylxylan esterase [uncultured Eudoraea sp.]|uniref:glucuronyl esterase domain-containing protein n=1 Tax=uncultured Eudoraea sp. TaxID=1035614 RepID=UPI00263068EA|nr:acetylxylan esterase [uncultured Eudoraea sp.]